MRVAFFGTPAYAVPTLDALVSAGHDVVTVVAQPDTRSGRGKTLRSPPTVVRARELGIGTRQPRGVRSGPFPVNYGALELDVAVVVAYGRILTQHLLDVPALGCINGHASLLPRWRGAGPIQAALLAGDTVTGVTTMQMDAGLDTGDMLLERAIDIGPDETHPQLAERLSILTAQLILETLEQLPHLTPRPQDHAASSHAPMLRKADAAMDWTRSAADLHNQVRALTPWPGTVTQFRGAPLKIKAARAVQGQGTPGHVLRAGPELIVACGQGALQITSGQLPGKPARSAVDLINGARIQVGEVMT